ncbi:PepSY domain-containing protein [Pseudomonas sp. G(2018)]|uniref:PepSY domain-containing protein n=1 Tax=Pseudomonas sp. G(2018) TaxID=2502242 RepID=UPI0010F948B2|nr:PepSY domain-containing protein [Pseudomonas sp. G(2018)]
MKSFLPLSSTRAVGCLALTLVAFCSATMARDLDQDEALRLRQQGVILPLEQVLQIALDRYPGAKLLEAELEEKHDVYMYEVELLTTEGVVRELDLDAATGRLLKDKED